MIDVRVSSRLKEELALAVGKRLRVISTIISTKELKGTWRYKFKTIVLVAMWPLVTYSNYFEIVCTVTFLDAQTELISGSYVFSLTL